MGLSQSSSRKMRWLLSWPRMDVALPYALLLLTGVMIAGAVWAERRSADQQMDLMTSRLATAAAQDIADSIEQFDRSLQAAIGRHHAPELQSQDARARNAALFERIQREPYFGFVDVLNEKGDSIAGLPQNINNWADRDYFRALQYRNLDTPFIGGRFSVDNEKNVGFTVSRRMNDTGGNFAGLVVMGVRLAYFRDLLQHLGLGFGDSVLLMRDDGVVLMRLPFDMNTVGDVVDKATPFRTAIEAKAAFVTTSDPIDHVERRFAFHRVGTLPLIVSVGVATEGMSTSPMLWWGVAASIAVLGAVIYLTRRLSNEKRRRAAAERESREKSRFLTTLSHELRTPLHGVLGYADQLSREDGLSAAQLRQVAEIIRTGRHMRDVVNVVLDYARIEALGPALHMHRIDVRRLAEECVAVIEPGARARGLETRVIMAPGAPAQFVTDNIQLRQVLINLLSNAVKYTPLGMIELRLKGDQEHLTIEVADSGIGIPEGRRHLLFKEYERFGTERTSIEGTGLGLAIAHRLTRRMGGHMGHRNNPGGGSVFWLELPAGTADQVEVAAAAVKPELSRRLNVLVVDDSEVNRSVAAAYLKTAGHDVVEAADGGEAVRLVGAQDFDVVLMDMRMAGMDGLEATRRIRALDDPRGQVPIIAVTANALDRHAEECRRAGMSEHLAKPFTQAELTAVVARAASQCRCRSCDAAAIDPEIMASITSAMGEEGVQHLLDCLALRIESLLRALEDPAAFASPDELAALAHELKGSGGTLGFTQLASVAARFEDAVAMGSADADEMRREAVVALAELRRRRSLEALLSV
jgi:signal transduction histidine kinase/DNA-binding NarL/FixJ family response regulator